MIRLSSLVGLYGFLLGIPVACVIAITSTLGNKQLQVVFSIMFSIPLLLVLLVFRRCKRVYYKDSSLYRYEPFSKKHIVVDKDEIGGINKILFYDPRFFKLVYYDDNKNSHYVYFSRNWWLLDDFNDIIKKINE